MELFAFWSPFVVALPGVWASSLSAGSGPGVAGMPVCFRIMIRFHTLAFGMSVALSYGVTFRHGTGLLRGSIIVDSWRVVARLASGVFDLVVFRYLLACAQIVICYIRRNLIFGDCGMPLVYLAI